MACVCVRVLQPWPAGPGPLKTTCVVSATWRLTAALPALPDPETTRPLSGAGCAASLASLAGPARSAPGPEHRARCAQCSHYFHLMCINTWLHNKNTCPSAAASGSSPVHRSRRRPRRVARPGATPNDLRQPRLRAGLERDAALCRGSRDGVSDIAQRERGIAVILSISPVPIRGLL